MVYIKQTKTALRKGIKENNPGMSDFEQNELLNELWQLELEEEAKAKAATAAAKPAPAKAAPTAPTAAAPLSLTPEKKTRMGNSIFVAEIVAIAALFLYRNNLAKELWGILNSRPAPAADTSPDTPADTSKTAVDKAKELLRPQGGGIAEKAADLAAQGFMDYYAENPPPPPPETAPAATSDAREKAAKMIADLMKRAGIKS